jgi:hypothetical protein
VQNTKYKIQRGDVRVQCKANRIYLAIKVSQDAGTGHRITLEGDGVDGVERAQTDKERRGESEIEDTVGHNTRTTHTQPEGQCKKGGETKCLPID